MNDFDLDKVIKHTSSVNDFKPVTKDGSKIKSEVGHVKQANLVSDCKLDKRSQDDQVAPYFSSKITIIYYDKNLDELDSVQVNTSEVMEKWYSSATE